MEDLTTCPICESLPKSLEYKPGGRFYEVSCPQCTEFDIEACFVEDGILEKYLGPIGSRLRTNASRWLSRDPEEVTDLRTEEDLKRLVVSVNKV